MGKTDAVQEGEEHVRRRKGQTVYEVSNTKFDYEKSIHAEINCKNKCFTRIVTIVKWAVIKRETKSRLTDGEQYIFPV